MIIELKNLSKQYNHQYALKDFSVTFEEGIYGILGENGAGKTTLISILVGILKGNTGEIYVDDINVKKLGREFLPKIGYLPQYPLFYKDFKVIDFLKYMCALKDIPKAMVNDRITDLLHIVNLEDHAHKKIGALSGGMRQRVGIVQAMLNDPHILILDEPTAGLDPQERIRFRNLITKFSDKRTILLATHIVSDVEFIANKVVIMKDGRLIKCDSPQNLINEIDGNVWSVNITEEKAFDHFSQYKISNMQRENNALTLRVISSEKIATSAVNMRPNLEEVFLYHCGEAKI